MNLLQEVIAHVLWVSVLAAPIAFSQPAETPKSPTWPNIVILYADDMGYGDLAIQNQESKIPTPHLDRLAREGMRFTDAHSSSGICTPSRYALLTGRYHWRKFHGIVNAFGDSVFAPERLTLPEMMQGQGYRTACIGKWHLGWDWKAIQKPEAKQIEINGKKRGSAADAFDWSRPIPNGPLAHGFDHYFGDDVPNFPPYTWIENDRVLQVPTVPYVPDPKPAEGAPEGRPGPMVAGWKQDAVMPELTRRAVQWISEQKSSDTPFFLYFPWTSPHAPIVPAKAYHGKTRAGGYGDFVHQSDAHAGQILEALDAHGFRENTLVIFTSDNGPEHYAYPRVRDFGHRSAGELRGLKRDIWEGGHRVPFVIRWPGVVKPGTVSKALIGQIDLMATIAEIVGHELPDTAAEDSQSFLPILKGAANATRDTLVHNTYADKFAIRHGSWVLIEAPNGQHSRVPKWVMEAESYETNAHPAALFDLNDDLGQRENRFAEQPDKVLALRARLKEIRERGFSAPRLLEKR